MGSSDVIDPRNILSEADARTQWFNLINNPPAYTGATNADGTLKSQYTLNGQPSLMPNLNSMLSGINLDKTGLNAYQNYAMDPNTSPWAQTLLDKENIMQGQNYDNASRASAAGTSQAYSDLGARGGLREGAAERIARGGARDLALSKAQVGRQGQLDRLGIMSQDQQQKLQALGQLPGMQLAALGPELQKTSMWATAAANQRDYDTNVSKTNIDNSLASLGGLNAYNMGNYQQKLQAYGADRTATAQENSGKK